MLLSKEDAGASLSRPIRGHRDAGAIGAMAWCYADCARDRGEPRLTWLVTSATSA